MSKVGPRINVYYISMVGGMLVKWIHWCCFDHFLPGEMFIYLDPGKRLL